MMYTLENPFVSISIASKGAELQSIRSQQREYLWQGDARFWGRRAPVLFPIVGRLKDDEFSYEGKTYRMTQHGFARDSEFRVVHQSQESIGFELRDDETTRAQYPFAFCLQIDYTLKKSVVEVRYSVENPSETSDLYFSIGAHPAFACPFETGEKRGDYQLEFEPKHMPASRELQTGLFTDATVQRLDGPGLLRLTDTVFAEDAVTFAPNPFSEVTFVHAATRKKYLRIGFAGFPYLGVWSSKLAAPFVCIEPWQGIADHVNHDKDLTQKEGIRRLAPKERFWCAYEIDVLEV